MPAPTRLAALATAALALGCSNDPIGATCKGKYLPGDLVISEIFANPTGDDSGLEWFEIYNAGEATDLAGLSLITSKGDGSGEKKHRMASVNLGAGDYLVIGTAQPGALPAYVGYAVGNDLGDLRNTDGRIALVCGTTLVDEVKYASAPDGVSLELSGALLPDAVANDDPAMWCNATAAADFGAGKGTPGAANESCKPVGPQTQCSDGGTMRDLVPPQAGDLVISEWMADPKGSTTTPVDDAKGEWFELLVNRNVDLNGLELGTAPPTVQDEVTDARCLRFTAGSRVLFARSKDSAQNGGLPPVDFTFAFGLTNSGGGIFVGYGGTVLDQVTYGSSSAGVATQLDAGKTGPADNDVAANLCPATATYGAGDKGTPGAANRGCGVTPANQCSEGGVLRDIVPPKVGDLVITEYMADPSKVNDAAGEWLEVRALNGVDLNGLQLGTDLSSLTTTLTANDCLKAAAGSLLVFARSDDSTMNGGLPRVDYVFGFSLVNSNKGIVLARGGALLDAVTYTTTTSGASTSLKPDKQTAADNDDPASWCTTPATSTYGLGDRGTPGSANPPCP